MRDSLWLGLLCASLPLPTRPLDASSTLRVVTAKTDSRHSQMSPDGHSARLSSKAIDTQTDP